MKKVLVVLGLLYGFTVSGMAIEVKTVADIPNLRASTYYDFVNASLGVGVESTLLRYKSIDLAVGYVEIKNKKSGIGAICINLDKLNIPNIEYAWKGINTSVGLWIGYNIEFHEWTCGINASLISIEK